MVTVSSQHNPLSARARLPDSSTPAARTPTTQPPASEFSQSRRPAKMADPLGERATAQLIRRVLLSEQHSDQLTAAALEGQLPPLTSSNEMDFQIYGLLAILIRDFVQAWYSKITPDETFVAELINIVAHISRATEQRLRKVDLESLLMDEIPDLLEQHIIAYRTSKKPGTRPPIEANSRQIYHALFPSPAMTPVPDAHAPESILEQAKNEAIYRKLLVQGMLAMLLPTEDFQSPCLTSLVGEILSETIIGNLVAKKVSQPWMMWEIIGIVCSIITGKKPPPKEQKRRRENANSTLESKSFPHPSVSPVPRKWSLQWLMIMFVQWGVMIYSIIRGTVHGFIAARKLPSRVRHNTSYVKPSQSSGGLGKVPVVTWKLFSFAGTLIEINDRMPWLSGNISLLQWCLLTGPGRIGGFDSVLDRYVSGVVRKQILDGNRVPGLIKSIRGSVFPNNVAGKSSLFPPANQAEEKELRKRTAAALASMMPKWMLKTYFCSGAWETFLGVEGSSEISGQDNDPDQRLIREIDETILDVFSDEYCNKHLMYAIVELALVRLIPELAEKTVEDLLDDRLGL
ncbi:hypothetical protein BROUX41_003122 [Berkeleyomyces rouxiae]|uniref:uncharacterized protein n=1 Tax=Berkeleyomyces rouxiae TaxID=2035830 RepID=UPI003B7EDB2B